MNRFEMINNIVDDTTLTGTQKLILIALWRFSDKNGMSYPSIATLMATASIKSRKAFFDNRQVLVERGYLEITTIKGKGCLYKLLGNKSNLVINDIEPSKDSTFNLVRNDTTNITKEQNKEQNILKYIHSEDNPYLSYISGQWMLEELSSEFIC